MPKMELTGRLITLLVENKDRVQSISGIIYTAIHFQLSKFKMNFKKITEIFIIREYIGIQTTQLKCLYRIKMKNKKLSTSILFMHQHQRISMQIHNSTQINFIFMQTQSIQSTVKDLILRCMLYIFLTRFRME